MTEKIYIVRHGYRMNWLNTPWTSPTGLPRDPPLTAYGETQAQELREYFMSMPDDERPTAIFSSPYYRCLQTSQPVASALNIPIFVEHGIAEWYSPVVPGSGLHPRPGHTESLQQHIPQVDTSWGTLYYPSRKGESLDELHKRIDEFIFAFGTALANRLPVDFRQRLLFVTHAATAIALVRNFVGDAELHMKVGCASLTELERKSPVLHERNCFRGTWKPVMLTSGTHLKGGSSREWGFEDVVIDKKGKIVEDPGIAGSCDEVDSPVGLQTYLISNL